MALIYQSFNIQLLDLLQKLHANFPENKALTAYHEQVARYIKLMPHGKKQLAKIQAGYTEFTTKHQSSCNTLMESKDYATLFELPFLIHIDFQNMYSSSSAVGQVALLQNLKPLLEYISIIDIVGDSLGNVDKVVSDLLHSGGGMAADYSKIAQRVNKHMKENPKEMEELAEAFDSSDALAKVGMHFPDVSMLLSSMNLTGT